MKKQILVTMFTILSLSLLSSGCSAQNESSLGFAAADFTVQTLDGKEVNFSKVRQEKKAVLVFWTTWCPYCKKEISSVNRFFTENKDKVIVFGINIGESKAKVSRFAKQTQISYPVLLDSDNNIATSYNVRGVPTVVAVSKDGKVLYQGHSVEEMQQRVEF